MIQDGERMVAQRRTDHRFVVPVGLIEPGARTGVFLLRDDLRSEAEENNCISAVDYPVAFLDEMATPL